MIGYSRRSRQLESILFKCSETEISCPPSSALNCTFCDLSRVGRKQQQRLGHVPIAGMFAEIDLVRKFVFKGNFAREVKIVVTYL